MKHDEYIWPASFDARSSNDSRDSSQNPCGPTREVVPPIEPGQMQVALDGVTDVLGAMIQPPRTKAEQDALIAATGLGIALRVLWDVLVQTAPPPGDPRSSNDPVVTALEEWTDRIKGCRRRRIV